MHSEQPNRQTALAGRLNHLHKIISDEKYQLLQKTKRLYDSILNGKKYREYRDSLRQRIVKSDKFIKQVSDTFFTMLNDQEFLAITTQVDLMQKIQKFKKNLYNSLHKITIIDQRRNPKDKKNSQQYSRENGSESSQKQIPHKQHKKRRLIQKSKNAKMSCQTSMVMMQWLLRNFENPYPTIQQKQKMSRQSRITVTQVNNWFINARQRTIKGYFIKDL